MTWHIINEIRRMERSYYHKYGKHGEVICLDANAEVKLAVFMASDFDYNNIVSVNNKHKFVQEILEEGIRHLGTIICGMKLKFDCPSFCIEPTDQMHFDFLMEHVG
jgi:hypothetical protein